jgi:small subunit ribosomal protein S7
MSRGKSAIRRVITPDPKYGSETVAKFVNFVMERGKKSVAQSIVYGALERLETKRKQPALQLFEQILTVIRPTVEVRSRRVGGANYQVPLPVSPYRQNALAFRWIIGAARTRGGRTMEEKLAAELGDILDGVGGSIKKKEDVVRMAEANKAFAHFARFAAK